MLKPNQIKARLVERGISQTSVARKLGISNITVSVVIGGYGKSMRIMKYLAEILEMPFNEVWGGEDKFKTA